MGEAADEVVETLTKLGYNVTHVLDILAAQNGVLAEELMKHILESQGPAHFISLICDR